MAYLTDCPLSIVTPCMHTQQGLWATHCISGMRWSACKRHVSRPQEAGPHHGQHVQLHRMMRLEGQRHQLRLAGAPHLASQRTAMPATGP